MSSAKTSLLSVSMSPVPKHAYIRSTVAIGPVATSGVAISAPFVPFDAHLRKMRVSHTRASSRHYRGTVMIGRSMAGEAATARRFIEEILDSGDWSRADEVLTP